MVPGLTDSKEAMEKFVRILRPIRNKVDRIEILPYHTSGVQKYQELGIPYRLEGVEPMDKDRAKELEIYANKLFAEDLRKERAEQEQRRIEKFRQLKEHEVASPDEKAEMFEILRGLPLLSDVDEEDVEAVLSEVIVANIKAGELVFKTGDAPDFMYLIYEGQMKIFVNTMDGEEQIFYIYRDGDFVGGLNLLVQTPYRYIGQALTDCKVVVIPKYTFDKYFWDSPVVLRSVLVKSFERIRWAEELIQRLSTSNASMKTAGLLLKLVRRLGLKPMTDSARALQAGKSWVTTQALGVKRLQKARVQGLGYNELEGSRESSSLKTSSLKLCYVVILSTAIGGVLLCSKLDYRRV